MGRFGGTDVLSFSGTYFHLWGMNASQRIGFPSFQQIDVSSSGEAHVVRFRQTGLLVDEFLVREIGDDFSRLAQQPECRRLIVDFTGVEDLSSYMLGRLVMLRKLMA